MKKGDRVMVRSSACEEPMWIGRFIGHCKIFHKYNICKIPVVIRESDGFEFMVMGICVPFNQDLWKNLQKLNHKEQWNYLISLKGEK